MQERVASCGAPILLLQVPDTDKIPKSGRGNPAVRFNPNTQGGRFASDGIAKRKPGFNLGE
jgi:hypothetical protein